ncbi:MAG: hypothetical protein AB7S78_02250 [Candidatus Omnitrophota bacterium]
MILQSKKFIYVLIFSLSFFILSLQVFLSSLLRYLLQLPFYAISFAFLGLSSAGIFTFILFNKKQHLISPRYLAGVMNAFNLALLAYVFIGSKMPKWLGNFNNFSFDQESSPEGFSRLLDYILIDILMNSVYYGLFISICFFFLGAAVAYLYKMFSDNAPRLYLFDLIGAAAGCLLAAAMLRYIQFSSIPLLMCCLSAILTYCILLDSPKARYSKYLTIVVFIVAAFTAYLNKNTSFFEIRNNPHYAVLDYEMKDDVKELWYNWNEYSRLSVLRHIKQGSTDAHYLFTIDGGRGNAHLGTYRAEDPYYFRLYDQFTAASIPYLLTEPKDILIMFVGAGIDMLHANSFSRGASDITGIELNPLIVNSAVKISRFHLKEFFDLDNIHMRIQEGRSFLESSPKKYDTIIFSWGGASFANYLGTSGYTGRYLYTKESMISVMKNLKPDGTVSIVNTNKLRLAAVMKEAFEAIGRKDFANHVIILDRKQDIYTTLHEVDLTGLLNRHILFFKMSPFTADEIALIRENAVKQNLDMIYTPDYVHPDYAVYSTVLRSQNTVKTMEDLSRQYLLDLTVTTDNRPFIENGFYSKIIFKKIFWQNIDRLSTQESTKQYTLNLYTIWFIIFLFMMAFVFILVPLFMTRTKTKFKNDWPYLYYFSVLGLGFILIEITVMNQFILFLGNPIYSFSLILTSLLTATGIGSYFSGGLMEKKIISIRKMAGVCSLVLSAYFVLLPLILQHWLGILFPLKIVVTFLIILPLGFCLGMMFPQGIKKLSQYNNDLVPWAWGLNGYMSTVGSAISIYLSMMTGFSWLILIAAGLYFSIVFLKLEK